MSKSIWDFPMKCQLCKTILCDDENGDLDQTYSDNYQGWLCKKCIESLYYCENCNDYADELIDGRYGLVCLECDDFLGFEDTRNTETLKRWIRG